MSHIPLPVYLAAGELQDALRPVIEGIAVKVATGAMRRMLVDAARSAAKGREDLDTLLAAAGRLMDEIESRGATS